MRNLNRKSANDFDQQCMKLLFVDAAASQLRVHHLGDARRSRPIAIVPRKSSRPYRDLTTTAINCRVRARDSRAPRRSERAALLFRGIGRDPLQGLGALHKPNNATAPPETFPRFCYPTRLPLSASKATARLRHRRSNCPPWG